MANNIVAFKSKSNISGPKSDYAYYSDAAINKIITKADSYSVALAPDNIISIKSNRKTYVKFSELKFFNLYSIPLIHLMISKNITA